MKRLILTYNQSCNLKCKFCYIDFHYKKIEDRTLEIVRQAISLGFDIITFGGGDSFSKRNFRNACRIAKINNIFIHVDTNGVSIREDDYDFINDNVDLLGISIDQLWDEHDNFRDTKNLFAKIDKTLTQLEKSNIEIKINTILTNKNKESIEEIFYYIKQFKNISRWSIYQFFPLSSARLHKSIYEITDEEFDNTLNFLNKSSQHFKIEKYKFVDRVQGYIFCDEEGKLYSNSIEGEYLPIGSIFNENDCLNLLKKDQLINPKTEDRYS
ncbi:radical SAM protein [Solibacillus daqui]|uniref:radical SAM protein n=1 Tax=Solibacillus daqui TaxID=2912187 RepID=UPI0023652E58|nr:radical SAM protein [Solibacillus daqui]